MTGTGLSSVGNVRLSDHDARVVSSNDTQLVIDIPPVSEPEQSDTYQLLIFITGSGYALMDEYVFCLFLSIHWEQNDKLIYAILNTPKCDQC